MPETLTNWARNQTYTPARVHHPSSVEELQEIVRTCRRCKVLGSGHTFNSAADTDGDMIRLDRLAFAPLLDEEAGTVTVSGGATYGDLVAFLAPTRWALPNLASLPHISVAGAIATATHGSGLANGNLASCVAALELVTADGELRRVTREVENFEAFVVHLGALGVVTRVTLVLVPSFEIRQDVYEDLSLEEACEHFEDVMGAAYSVSLFTTWKGLSFETAWLKSRVEDVPPEGMPTEWHGAMHSKEAHHPVPGVDPEACTEQLGVPGPWHARLPHFRLEFTPSVGEELQSEYFVARCHAPAALRALAGLRDRIAPLLMVSEIRTIKQDQLWMSTAYLRDSVAFHFTWKPLDKEVRELLPALEAALAPFAARPHLGKVFAMKSEQLTASFPRLGDFARLRRELDPLGKFGNTFLEECGSMA